jgi:general stress protein YciG
MLTAKQQWSMDVREMARMLGRRGGRARAKRLSAERRRQIASLGGQARHRSLQAARRILDNLRYAAAVLELRGGGTEGRPHEDVQGALAGTLSGRTVT